ncbi:MAG: SRPBCC domain-containing protein [Promethearchaeota archaeon]
MPRAERKIEINAPPEKVYSILEDSLSYPIWNIVVNEIKEIGPNKYFSKTNIGDITSTIKERVPNKNISSTQEGSPMTAYGNVLEQKGDGTIVTLWAEFEKEENEKMLLKAGEIYLESLKRYAEYLEEGGDPSNYDKKKK